MTVESSLDSENRITLEGYLRRDYVNERECEFVDGQLEERTGGETSHGMLHGAVASWFAERRSEWNIVCAMSYSMWISPTRIRIPDIVVMADKLREDIRVTPPLLCIKILAPEDTLHRLLPRLDDIVKMGVKHLWLIDANERVAFTYDRMGLRRVEASRLTVPDSPIYLDLPEVFCALD